jgi:membrane peptidoglycan carboxypeptidase
MLEKPMVWSGRSLETISIGHEVAVNLVQLVSAFAAVANDGVLMEPRIVREVRRPDGTLVEEYPPVPVRRVISVETSRTMREFLAGVVKRGTAKNAAVCEWPTGGKSGTAQMLRPDGRFSQKDFISSFVGFVPVGNPRVVAAVVLVDPSGISAGGLVAGPVFRDILTKAVCSDLSVCFEPELQREAVREWLRGSGGPGPSGAEPGLPVQLSAEGRMPDLKGLPLRLAKQILLAAGASVDCLGTGEVASQVPEAGERFRPSGICLLTGASR